MDTIKRCITVWTAFAIGLTALGVRAGETVAGRVVSDAPTKFAQRDRNNGYVVFQFSTLKNLPPSHVPAPKDVVDSVACLLARDEFESIQLGVYALAENLKDILVTVESDLDVSVFHRISPDVKDQLTSLYQEGNGIARWVPSQVHLQRGRVFAELPAGQSVNFWLTFRANAGTRAGLHRGKIRIKPAGRAETVLDLELTVRPFKLQRPRAAFGMFFREDMLPKQFGGLAASRKSVLAMYRDMAAHGHNSGWFYPSSSFKTLPPRNNHALEKLIPLARQAGMLDPNVPSLLCGGIPGDHDTGQLQAAAAWLKAECQRRGWPAYPRDADAVRRELTKLRGVPFRVNLDLSATAAYGYGDLCDVLNVMDGEISPEMLAEARRRGTQIWTYSYRIWREDFDPLRQRFYAGLYTWTHRLGGNWIWAYHHGHHRHAWFAPKEHEPMPVTGYEARREGIDDYRYLQMLEDCVAVSQNRTAALEAARWLKTLRTRLAAAVPNKVTAGKPLAIGEYDAIRSTAANFIQKLGPVRSAVARRSPSLHAKDEAAAFRDQPLTDCIAGLASRDVSNRRAAAWALFELGPKAATAAEPLAGALDDPAVRIPALRALEAIGPAAFPAVPRIASLLKHSDFYVRIGTVLALGEIGCPLTQRDRSGRRVPSKRADHVIEPLTLALRDAHPSLSYQAAEMLSVMGPRARPALPQAIAMLDDPSPTRRSAAIGLITGLGSAATDAVPRLIKNHPGKAWDARYIRALAAIGPAATPAIPSLEKLAAQPTAEMHRADALQALFCIRGEVADLRKLVEMLSDMKGSPNAKRHVVKLLDQLGAKAAPVAIDVRRLLKSGKVADFQEGLESFLRQVKTGSAPGISFEW